MMVLLGFLGTIAFLSVIAGIVVKVLGLDEHEQARLRRLNRPLPSLNETLARTNPALHAEVTRVHGDDWGSA